MNATPTQKDWTDALAEATGETTPAIVAETRQEAALLTGNFAGTVDAIIADMEVHERLEKASENLDSAAALMYAEETRERAMEAYGAANASIHELEKMKLTETEKSKLSALNRRLITIGLEFAAPGHAMEEYADLACPA